MHTCPHVPKPCRQLCCHEDLGYGESQAVQWDAWDMWDVWDIRDTLLALWVCMQCTGVHLCFRTFFTAWDAVTTVTPNCCHDGCHCLCARPRSLGLKTQGQAGTWGFPAQPPCSLQGAEPGKGAGLGGAQLPGAPASHGAETAVDEAAWGCWCAPP